VSRPGARREGADRDTGRSVVPHLLDPTSTPLFVQKQQDAKKAAKAAAKAKAKERLEAMEAAKAAGPGAGASKKAAAKAEKEAARVRFGFLFFWWWRGMERATRPPSSLPHTHHLPSSPSQPQAKEAEELEAAIAAAASTPAGSKKNYATPFPKGYAPRLVEAATYAWWEAAGFFAPDAAAKAGTPASHADDAAGGPPDAPFTMVIPPPNVTGSLHLGHALMASIEDAIVRWHRMCGRRTLWVPGTDHAGIATQTVVEKQLAREKGLTRHDLGREAFVDSVHAWVDKYGNTICSQLRRLGASPDWTRQAFTMDARCSRAVREAFLRLHSSGLVYRDHRLVNWSTRLKTAISDIEVEYVDVPAFHKLRVPGYDKPVEFGVLTSFAYPLEGGAQEGADGSTTSEIVVATTRPETMLGDTAVAVHPDDPRYAHLVGSHVLHPLSGRRIPIIADGELVDMSFGTGAVKITPAHDPNDFATGKRHNLEFMSVFDDEGRITAAAGGDRFGGLGRFDARVAVVDWLKEAGLFRGVAGNPMRLGLCSRSGDVVEPVLKPQWWVSCGGMAAKAGDAVRSGAIRVVPPEAEATWHRWLDNIRDWCVSRQLWWGHRIPAFYVTLASDEPGAVGPPGSPTEDTSRWVVAPDEAAAKAAAAAKFPGVDPDTISLIQDEDVLDTWFSSGLFPFSVFGWPDETPDLQTFYPTSLLETGHDILFFWVARMVMMGLELTGQSPFHTIYLHTMVRDAHGRKMSKSLGNVVDPLHVIEGISLEGLHATLEGTNLDPREVEVARKGQKADFPDGIEECGADALRLALVSYTTQARDINLDIQRVVTYRHWCNKLWNAIRFAVLNLGGGGGENGGDASSSSAPLFKPDPAAVAPGAACTALPLACRWLLSRLDAAAAAASEGFAAYEFAAAAQALYVFWQNEVCDVFIELVKPAVAKEGDDPATAVAFRQTLWAALDAGLRLLHPLMPFVTEELWQRLPRGGDAPVPSSIMVAPYPTPAGRADPGAEADMAALLTTVTAARSLRAGYGLVPRQAPPLYVLPSVEGDGGAGRVFAAEGGAYLAALAPSTSVTVLAPGEAPPAGCGVAVVDDRLSVALALAGVLDPAKELAKLQTRSASAASTIDRLRAARAASGYTAKTPAEVQEADAEKLAKAEAEAAVIAGHIADMERLSLADKAAAA
jgi:valyl-tRNA synthetase